MKTKTTTLILLVSLFLTASSHAASLDLRHLGNDLDKNGWFYKFRTAAQYKSGGSKYRTYMPTVSPAPGGGVFISTKIDHIRGFGGDDHCLLGLTFNPSGILTEASAKIEMGSKSFDTGIIRKRAAISADVFISLTDQVSKWKVHGGRANFPAVVQHNINLIAKWVTK